MSSMQHRSPRSECGEERHKVNSGGRGTQVFVMTLLATEAVVSTMNNRQVQPGGGSNSESESPLPTPGGDSLSSRCSECPMGEGSAESPMAQSDLAHDLQRGSPLVQDAAIIAAVAEYLPWREATRLRAVSSTWRGAVLLSGVKITTLPGSAVPAAFVRCPADLLKQEAAVEAKYRCVHEGQWRCEGCLFWNSETRMLCGNRQCQRPAASHANNVRVFAGQLRREGTVPLLQWILTAIIDRNTAGSPTMDIVNIDNHRHPVTQRGKGCAWVYVKKTSVSDEMLRYHHRVFLDTDDEADAAEGVWIVPPSGVAALAEYVATRAYLPERSILLPRNCLVLELPGTQAAKTVAPTTPVAPVVTLRPHHHAATSRPPVFKTYQSQGASSVHHGHAMPPPPPPYAAAQHHQPYPAWYTTVYHQDATGAVQYRHDPYAVYQSMPMQGGASYASY